MKAHVIRKLFFYNAIAGKGDGFENGRVGMSYFSGRAALKTWLAAVGLLALLMAALLVRPAYGATDYAKAITSSSYGGKSQVETAVQQSRAVFDSSAWVVVVGVGGWADALSAAGVAGALGCPILFAGGDGVPAATEEEIVRLGAERALIVGGEGVVGAEAESELSGVLSGSSEVTRVFGKTYYDTQLELFRYADGQRLWGSGMFIVAGGESYYDALSVAPAAYANAAPIFLVDGTRDFSAEQQEMILGAVGRGYLDGDCLIVGGTSVVSERAEGFLSFASVLATGSASACARLSGPSLFDTNVAVAEWMVSHAGMKWDGLAFASASGPYDALSGAAVQGRRGSVLLLVGDALSPTISAAASHAGSMRGYSLFGGTGVIPESLRSYIAYSLQFGYALPMGPTRLPDRTYIWCDSSGVYREDSAYYGAWMDRANQYSSSTGWLILVDTTANKMMVFSGFKGAWVVEKDWVCTTGAFGTPTVKGQFRVGMRGISFGSGYTCWYWTQFYGNYLFHSVLYRQGSMSQITDGRLGINASHGCVRLDINNAKWVYDNIPYNTTVVVY